MAASPMIGIRTDVPTSSPTSPLSKRRPLILTSRRLAANRRNATRSTGPRTAEGKGSRVARNPIKHGFFAGQDKWTLPQQRSRFRRDLRWSSRRVPTAGHPRGKLRRGHRRVLHSDGGDAAIREHRGAQTSSAVRPRVDERIAAADAVEAARLRAHREHLRRGGLWRPTIPGPRELGAIVRYSGRLYRAIRHATAALDARSISKAQKQSHFIEENRGIFQSEALKSVGGMAQPLPTGVLLGEGPQTATSHEAKSAKTNRREASPSGVLSAARRTSNTTVETGNLQDKPTFFNVYGQSSSAEACGSDGAAEDLTLNTAVKSPGYSTTSGARAPAHSHPPVTARARSQRTSAFRPPSLACERGKPEKRWQ